MRRGHWLLGVAALPLVVGAGLGLSGCHSEARSPRNARVWYVTRGAAGGGTGAQDRPLASINDALASAAPGDTVEVAPGTYEESLRTRRAGEPDRPILIRAANPARRPVVTAPGRVATFAHPHVQIDGLVLDGQFGPDDAVRVGSEANGLVMRRVEVRQAGRDCVDMGAPQDVLLDEVVIHHCLDARNGRTDAHGIVAGAVERLTIRRADIHTFSGDGIQVDPGRGAPGWTGVTVEDSRLWLAPLVEATNGFAAGVVPGENGIDTKTPRDGRRATLAIRNVEAWGFTGGLISNMAAFNLKERVDVTIDGATVHHSEIAFRVRGPGDAGASVDLRNVVLHQVRTGIRYEDDIAVLRVSHMTAGPAVEQVFRRTSSPGTMVDVQRLVVLGGSLPEEAARCGDCFTRPATPPPPGRPR